MQKNVKKMTFNYSPNFDLKKRDKKKIKYLIYHYTGMKNDKLAIKKLTSLYSNVSCHYYITKSGKLIQMVPDLFVAWHAGESYWGNDKSINYNSIGIEISNPGHGNGYRNFSDKQIKCLIRISKLIIKKYNIDKNKILGHSDIAPLRKIDPGEKFPWRYLSSQGIGIYPKKVSDKQSNYSKIQIKGFLKNLHKIGYRYLDSNLRKKIIKNFQRRYRPRKINGILDLETIKISEFIAKNQK